MVPAMVQEKNGQILYAVFEGKPVVVARRWCTAGSEAGEEHVSGVVVAGGPCCRACAPR